MGAGAERRANAADAQGGAAHGDGAGAWPQQRVSNVAPDDAAGPGRAHGQRPAVCVVMASEGYPGKYERGQAIRGLDEAAKLPDVKVFHAGTRLREDQVVADGGRVLGVTALGSSISAAKLQAYTAVKAVRFSGGWCRKDISDKALNYK